jgi:hypothetical protein
MTTGKFFRVAPEFQPRVSLEEGKRQEITALDCEGKISDSDRIY